MSEIPNVSYVFRQLSSLSKQVDSLVITNQKGLPTQYTPTTSNFRAQPSLLISPTNNEKQSKHRFLMDRLKSSVDQTRALLGTTQPFQYTKSNPSETLGRTVYSYESAQRPSPYSYQTLTYTNPNQEKRQSTKFQMPKIKYRHLETTTYSSTPTILENSVVSNVSSTKEFGIQCEAESNQKIVQGETTHNPSGLNPTNTAPTSRFGNTKPVYDVGCTRCSANENELKCEEKNNQMKQTKKTQIPTKDLPGRKYSQPSNNSQKQARPKDKMVIKFS